MQVYTVSMLKRDDDDDLPSASRAEFFTHADHGKQEQREHTAKAKGDLLKFQRQMLAKQVDPAKDAARDDTDRHDQGQQDAQKKPMESATKTREQEMKDQVQDAQDQPTGKKMLQQAKQEKAAKEKGKIDFQQNMS